MQPDQTHIRRLLAAAGVEADVEEVPVLGPVLRCAPADAPRLLATLAGSERGFSFLVDLFGIDTGEAIDVVYHIRSFVYDEELHIKARHEYDSELLSVWESYPAALMPERECAEMFGLSLAGHPNPKYLLVTEGVEPLLRKSIDIRGAEEVRDR